MAVHILVFPYPAQGHMPQLLDLVHNLAVRCSLTFTVLVTPKNLPSLSPLLTARPSSVQTLVLPFPPHPNLPPGAENVRDVGNASNVSIIASLHCLRDPIIEWFHSHPNPPAAIISDFFLGWTHRLAADLSIPRIAFFSVRAFLPSVLDHCWRNLETVRSLDVVPFPDLPGTPALKANHLPSIFRLYRESDNDWEVVRDGMLGNTSSSWGCVFNSFDDLESKYLDHLKKKMGHGRVYGVGPLSLTGLTNTIGGPVDSDSDLFRWLDGCPDGSVLYVCFGSQKAMSTEQIDALGSALEKSGVRFIWVLKTGTAGGENSTMGHGKVIKGWAPQSEILNHRAVGYFLSHCGWNSTQEAILAGVVILGWPMEADQYLNARLVEDMGVAVWVCEGPDTVPDPEELGQAIAGSMREDMDVKGKAEGLRKKALATMMPGGRSSIELDRLVKDIYSLISSRKT